MTLEGDLSITKVACHVPCPQHRQPEYREFKQKPEVDLTISAAANQQCLLPDTLIPKVPQPHKRGTS